MPVYFLDSSALVKAYRREIGTLRVLELLDGSDLLILSQLAHVEVSSAIARRGQAAGMPVQDLGLVLAELDREISQSFGTIELLPPIMARAVELTRSHRLRGADAIQLACALWAAQLHSQQQLVLVGSDQELNAAASLEGLATLDPTQG
jgi:predicted nucleic acid-binding protein